VRYDVLFAYRRCNFRWTLQNLDPHGASEERSATCNPPQIAEFYSFAALECHRGLCRQRQDAAADQAAETKHEKHPKTFHHCAFSNLDALLAVSHDELETVLISISRLEQDQAVETSAPGMR
jgi:hypothetical protein